MPNNDVVNQARIAMLAARGVGVNSSYRNGRYGRKGWGNNPPDGKPSGLSGGGGDPFWADVSMLLRFQGVNASTVFVDDSPLQAVVPYAVGNAQLSTTDPLLGDSSMVLTGATGACGIPYNAAWLDYNTPFTCEVLIQYDSYITPQMYILATRSGSSGIEWRFNGTTNGLTFTKTGFTNYNQATTSVAALVAGTTYVFCMERREDGIWYFYLDGVQYATATPGTVGGTGVMYLGMNTWNNLLPASGKFGAFRWTKAARYNGDHTPQPFTVG